MKSRVILFCGLLSLNMMLLPLAQSQSGDSEVLPNKESANPVEGLFRGIGGILQSIIPSNTAESGPKGYPNNEVGTSKESVNPIEGLFRGLGGVIQSAISPKHAEFSSLVKEKKYRAASSFYEKERQYFNENKGRYTKELREIADALNEEFSPLFSADNKSIVESVKVASESNNDNFEMARRLGAAINSSEQHLRSYDAIFLLKDQAYRSAQATELEVLIQKSRGVLSDLSRKAFATFDHFQGRSFFNELPVSETKSQFLSENLPLIEGKIGGLESERIGAFLETYQSDLGEPEKKKIANLQIEAVRRESIGQSPVAVAIRTQELSRKYNVGLDRAEIQLILLAVDEGVEQSVDLDVQNDLGLRVGKASIAEAESIAVASGAPLTVFTRVVSVETNRKVLSKREEHSRYQSGTRTLPNPDYEIARQSYLQAENSYNQTQLRNSLSAPAQNWGQVLGRMAGEIGGAVSRDRALAALKATPQTITEPVYTQYTFRVSEVEVSKSAKVIVVVLNPQTRQAWTAEREFSDSKTFSMSFNVHPHDENGYANSSRYVTEAELIRFEKAPIKWASSEILKTVNADDRGATGFVSVTSLLESMAPVAARPSAFQKQTSLASPVIDEDPRSESVVVVMNPKGSLGSGFFVDTGLILTNYHVVEGASFAEIKLKDGKVTYGKVVKTDPGRDLALIRVSEGGLPAKLSEERLSAGQQVEAIGHPKGLQFSLTRGVVSAVRKRPIPEIGHILLIQTDTPISPGNSGGPLFFKDRVIGVNTWKLSSQGTEGLSFAIHVNEIRTFLSAK